MSQMSQKQLGLNSTLFLFFWSVNGCSIWLSVLEMAEEINKIWSTMDEQKQKKKILLSCQRID